MSRRLTSWIKPLLVLALLGSAPLSSHAGPKEFADSLAGLLNQMNESMSAAGKKLKKGIKEGGVQQGLNEFNQGLTEMEAQMEPKRAALFAALSDLPSWIPNAIKNTWKDFVGALKTVLDMLKPNHGGNQGGGDPPAPPPPPAPPADDPGEPPAPPPVADEPAEPPAPPVADEPAEPAPPVADEPAEPAPPAAEEPAEPTEPPPAAEEGGEAAGDEQAAPAEPPAEEAAPPADEAAPPADEAAPPAAEHQGPADDLEAALEGQGAPAAPRASQEDPWSDVKTDFLAASPTQRFETFGRVGTLLMAEQRKQKKGQDNGALDARTVQTLTDKLDPVRKLLAWMGGHLSEELAVGQGYPALESQLQIIGPKASLQVFGEVIRTARRRAQRPDAAGNPRNPVSADKLEQIQTWLETPKQKK